MWHGCRTSRCGIVARWTRERKKIPEEFRHIESGVVSVVVFVYNKRRKVDNFNNATKTVLPYAKVKVWLQVQKEREIEKESLLWLEEKQWGRLTFICLMSKREAVTKINLITPISTSYRWPFWHRSYRGLDQRASTWWRFAALAATPSAPAALWIRCVLDRASRCVVMFVSKHTRHIPALFTEDHFIFNSAFNYSAPPLLISAPAAVCCFS